MNQQIRWKKNQLGSLYKNNPYRDFNRTKRAILNSDHKTLSSSLARTDFDTFSKSAYASKEGYAIRSNPISGETEMFVAGTRNTGDWISNLIEGGLTAVGKPGGTPWRKRAQRKYEKIAKDRHVSILYGHSRGGAIVADMKLPANVTKVGLDAAMVIANNTNMLNLNEAGHGLGATFDLSLSIRGKRNEYMNLGSNIHHVWN